APPADKNYLLEQGLGVSLPVGSAALWPPYIAPPVASPLVSGDALSVVEGVVLAFLPLHAKAVTDARSTTANIFFIDSLRWDCWRRARSGRIELVQGRLELAASMWIAFAGSNFHTSAIDRGSLVFAAQGGQGSTGHEVRRDVVRKFL